MSGERELSDQMAVTLTIAEWNQILGILGEAPFRAVASLIGKIQQQAQSQPARPPGPTGGPQLVAD